MLSEVKSNIPAISDEHESPDILDVLSEGNCSKLAIESMKMSTMTYVRDNRHSRIESRYVVDDALPGLHGEKQNKGD